MNFSTFIVDIRTIMSINDESILGQPTFNLEEEVCSKSSSALAVGVVVV